MTGSRDIAEMLEAGLVRHRAGNLDAAREGYTAVLEAAPDNPQAHRLMGVALAQSGHIEEAEQHLRSAVEAAPGDATGWDNLGLVLRNQGRGDEAAEAFERALKLNPRLVSAQFNLGQLHQMRGEPERAAECYRASLEAAADFAPAHGALGTALMALGEKVDARQHLERAIALAPEDPLSRYNLGVLEGAESDREAALVAYEAALALRPDYADALLKAATALLGLGRLDDAIERCTQALALRPNWPEAHWNRALARLQAGDMAEGFAEYTWRWGCPGFVSPRRDYPFPHWDGTPLEGRRLLIWGEQGVGDQVFFAGMIADLAEAGADLVVTCEKRLVPLFARSFPEATILPEGGSDDEAILGTEPDLQSPMGALGHHLRGDPAKVPARQSYLEVDSELVTRLRIRYAPALGGPRIGISWRSGNRDNGPERSLPLAAWKPILERAGGRAISLQYGDVGRQIAGFHEKTGIELLVDGEIDPIADLDGFAAQVAAMDMVISVDNSTVHFAGALGIPTHVLLPVASDWRWQQNRKDTPWYPSISLHRQKRPRDWDTVVSALARELAQD
jgi:tetratricopeptide (TPR) repeat protein